MKYILFAFSNHLLLHNIHILSIHYGESYCVVIKNSDVEYLRLLTNKFPDVILVNVLSSISNGYQYLFVKEKVDFLC